MKNHWLKKVETESKDLRKELEHGAGLWDWQQNAYAMYLDKLEAERKERLKNFSLTSSQL